MPAWPHPNWSSYHPHRHTPDSDAEGGDPGPEMPMPEALRVCRAAIDLIGSRPVPTLEQLTAADLELPRVKKPVAAACRVMDALEALSDAMHLLSIEGDEIMAQVRKVREQGR